MSASRSKPATRDHSPMYIDGAYCACRRAHRVERVRDRGLAPLEQALAGEQRAVELTLAELHTEKRSTRTGAALPAASRTRTVSV